MSRGPGLKRTYTVPEAAAILKRSERQVRRMTRAGLLRSIQAPGGRRVVAADIWALLRWGRRAAFVRAHARRSADARASVGVEGRSVSAC